MAGDRDVYVRGLAFLDALEFGLNNSAEFKHFDSLAQEAMIGSKATLVRRRQISGPIRARTTNCRRSTSSIRPFTADLDITPIIYLSSGQRATGMTAGDTAVFAGKFHTVGTEQLVGDGGVDRGELGAAGYELCTKATQTETSVLEKRGREEFEAMAKELEELRAFKRAHEAKSESSDDDDDDDDEEPAPKRAKSEMRRRGLPLPA